MTRSTLPKKMETVLIGTLPLELLDQKPSTNSFEMVGEEDREGESWHSVSPPIKDSSYGKSWQEIHKLDSHVSLTKLFKISGLGHVIAYSSQQIHIFQDWKLTGSVREDGISALEIVYLYMPSSQPVYCCIAVGFLSGALKIYDLTGNLIVAHHVHQSAILSIDIRIGSKNMEDLQDEKPDTDELVILHRDGRLASIDALGVWMNVKMSKDFCSIN